MTSRKQIDAFERKNTKGGMTDFRFTITFNDGRRTPILKGNELRVLDTFASMAQVGDVLMAEADHDTGYYEVGLDVLECDCGDGVKCDKVKVTSYDRD
jgi:hypothetical protein